MILTFVDAKTRKKMNFKLRSYQIDKSKEVFTTLSKYKLAILNGEVRTGKTHIALEVAKNYNSVLFVTKKKAISSIEDDYKAANHSFDITIINFESLHKVKGNFDLVVIDESHSCFLGNTDIDGVKIKDIKVGGFQKSFNFVKGVYEQKKVVNVFKNKLTEDLIKIKCNGKEIICTESHEIFTKRGWVKAREILPDDELQVV